MESKKLDRLAELFWKGETSEAQELELREAILYGPESDVHEELRDYFKYAEEIKGTNTLGDLFDVQVMNEIDSRSADNSSFIFFKIAAGIAILLGLFFALRSMLDDNGSQLPLNQEIVIVDTYQDPEQAYQEVKNALMLVSKNMNQGLSYTGSLGQFDKAKGKINKENRDEGNRPTK